MSKPFYITTAIDYVNSTPHIGTAYEKIGADALARWHRLRGEDVHLQMGNDEHSVNVRKAAIAKEMEPKPYCDEMRTHFEKVWQSLEISYDGFIQTTDPHHEKGVQTFLARIMETGDIYKKRYEGWYCESCEAFLTEKDLADGLCPNHKSKPQWLSEENYFFRLSNYRDKLLAHIESHPEFILPETRRNEIVNFLKEGLDDISVSRASVDWGIPVPNDPDHVVYVWFDALINYITAIGYGWDDALFAKWWPADMHVIGKDITRFHCIIWPAMLMSAGLELPRTIFGHGFVSLKGEKMSKTLGNVVTPLDVIDAYGADPLRFYLLREGGFGRDSDFTWEHFIERYNGDLANGIGNLVARTIGMADRYQEGVIRPPKTIDPALELAQMSTALPGRVAEALDANSGEIAFHTALANMWEVIAVADRYVNDTKPWVLAKAEKFDEINTVLWNIASSVRVVAILLAPFMPATAKKIWETMGLSALGAFDAQTLADAHKPWGVLDRPITVVKAEGLFPRIEATDEGRGTKDEGRNNTKEKKQMEEIKPGVALLDIADFAKVELRVAQVLEAERVEKTDKLLKLKVTLGEEERQIVAGIAQHYAPEELVGKKIVIVANLKPAKLRGIESQGMLLAASDEETVSILTPLKDVAVGSKVK